jgi:hypothetical protein
VLAICGTVCLSRRHRRTQSPPPSRRRAPSEARHQSQHGHARSARDAARHRPQDRRAIIEYRTKSGGFKRIEELMNVKGIGEKSFLKLKPLVAVPPKTDKAPGD